MARVENENILYSPDEEASGVNTLRGATDEARDYEKKMASGGLSLAQQQLRQGLSSAAQQQAAMGAGGGLSARAGMLAGAQQASQGVGQSAALRAQEESGARQQTMGALTNQAAGQAAHAGQQMQASQAQAEHHAAIMAENRAQEEADRAFGMEIAGALVGAVSGGAALASGGGGSSMDLKDRRSTGERSSLMTSPAGAKNPDGTLVDPNDPADPANTYEGKFPGLRDYGTFGKNVSSEKLRGALAQNAGEFTSRERADPAAQGMGSAHVIGGRPTAQSGRHMFYHDTTPIERGPGAAPGKPAEVYDNPDLSPPEENPSAHLSPSGAATPGVAREDVPLFPEYRRESVLPGRGLDQMALDIDSQREYPNTQGTSDQLVYKGNASRGLEDRAGATGGQVRDAGYMPGRVENRQSKSLAETMGEKAYEKGFADYRKGLADDKKSKAAQDWKKRAGESRYARKKKDKGTRKYSDDLGGKIERGFQKYQDALDERDERDYKSKLREKATQWGEARKDVAKHKVATMGRMPKSGPEGALRGAAKKGGFRGVLQAAGSGDSEMRGKEPLPPNYLAGWKPMYPGEQPGDHLSSVTSSERNPRYGTNDVVETREDGSRVNRSLEQEKRSKLADFMNRLDEEGTNARRADDEMAMHVGRRVRERMQTAPERERGFERTDSGDVNETLDGLQTYPYTYKKPEDRPKEGRGLDLDQGPRRGPMAEELGETPLGKEAVIDTPTGEKIHHDNYLYGVVTPGLKEVHEREKETRSKVDALAAQLDRLGKETERRMAGGKKKRGRKTYVNERGFAHKQRPENWTAGGYQDDGDLRGLNKTERMYEYNMPGPHRTEGGRYRATYTYSPSMEARIQKHFAAVEEDNDRARAGNWPTTTTVKGVPEPKPRRAAPDPNLYTPGGAWRWPPERRYEDGPTFDDVRHHMDVVEETPPLPSYQDPNEDLGEPLDDKTRAAVDRYRNFYDHLSSTVPTSRHPGNPRGFSFSHGTQREREDRHGRK